jgi:hypothetical protein
MNKYLKYITLSAVAVAVMPMASCSDDETVDPYDINYVYLYQPDETFAAIEYKANGTFLNDFTDPLSLVPVRLTKPAPQDVAVEVAIDESLVDEYNAANSTSYTFLTGASLIKTNFTIAQGKYITDDSIKVSFNDRSGFMKDAENLILPIVIKQVSGGITISENSRIFLTYNSTYRANKVSVDAGFLSIDTEQSDWQTAYSNYTITNFAVANWNADDAITLSLQIDNSLIDAYNAENGATYQALNASLPASQITIPAGSKTADLSVSLGDYSGVANDVEYVVPIKVTAISGLGAELANEVAYLTVGNTPPTFTASSSASSLGSALTPGSWSMTCDLEAYDYNTSSGTYDISAAVTTPGNQLFNFDSYTKVTLDMGAVTTVKGFSISLYAWYYSINSIASIETSSDGASWKEWSLDGSFPRNATTVACAFAKAVKCRYIRISSGKASYSDEYGWLMTAMYVY